MLHVAQQAATVQVVVAVGAREQLPALEAVQADDTLAVGEVTLSQTLLRQLWHT